MEISYLLNQRIRSYIYATPLEHKYHLSTMGANAYLKLECQQELKSFKVRGALSKLSSLTIQERRQGVISKQDIESEIGDVISGNVAGRLSDNDITISDSTGIALQDLIVANLALHNASENGVGKIVEL